MNDKKTKEQEKIRSRRAKRATYDLPPELKKKVAELSIKYGVPQSQIVAFLLYASIEDIKNNRVNLSDFRTESTSPKFAYNIDLKKAKNYFSNRSDK